MCDANLKKATMSDSLCCEGCKKAQMVQRLSARLQQLSDLLQVAFSTFMQLRPPPPKLNKKTTMKKDLLQELPGSQQSGCSGSSQSQVAS